MAFYSSIAKNYDYIFPILPAQVSWVEQYLSPDCNWLDIGCATGKLPVALSGKAKKVTGIDLDDGLLQMAKERNSEKKVTFAQRNMLELRDDFGQGELNVITCLGNTLVHLTNKHDQQKFFDDSFHVLDDDGKLLVQIINYDRILNKKIDGLPTIDNEHVRFVRNYIYNNENHLIDFATELTVKATNEKLLNSVWLYPLVKGEVENMARKSGFSNIEFFGSFKGDELTEDSLPLIFICSK